MQTGYSSIWEKYPLEDKFYVTHDNKPYYTRLHSVTPLDVSRGGVRGGTRTIDLQPHESSRGVVGTRNYTTVGETYGIPLHSQSGTYVDETLVFARRELDRCSTRDISQNIYTNTIDKDVSKQDIDVYRGLHPPRGKSQSETECGPTDRSLVDPVRTTRGKGLEFDLFIQSDPCPFGFKKVAKEYFTHPAGESGEACKAVKYTCVREQYPVDKSHESKLHTQTRERLDEPYVNRIDNGFYSGIEFEDALLANVNRVNYEKSYTSVAIRDEPTLETRRSYTPGSPASTIFGNSGSSRSHSGLRPLVREEMKPSRFSNSSINPHTHTHILYRSPHQQRSEVRYATNPVTGYAGLGA